MRVTRRSAQRQALLAQSLTEQLYSERCVASTSCW
jgi:hypothetical protein